ncbi:AraC family transcriptional regulator [Paenibacillus mucilaginosus 3016]|uniref:AraC family transcriptional regulator n=1 Tax=Paenibacillus mucilaginosus 3016 TaxID=1116391 RepID=H6N954_9BACL|nr:AraC family transcriptional regulator [Paenibacillus mucilaginosus]AFC27800.1 AraC family transcriptional regulator [Paenibacillus mucilaginosus 3016]WFA16671.1 AraC family transcriptional regulator [Paenibacillus mucilaginosus]
MNSTMPVMDIFNELSEFITLRMKSCKELTHDRDWHEHKAHSDYDLWFIQSGTVQIHIGETEHTANPGDVVFFYPGVPYRAASTDKGCRFIYAHFDFGMGTQQRILNDFRLSGIITRELIQDEAILFDNSFRQVERFGGTSGNRLHLKACMTALIAKIIELYGKGHYHGTFPKERMPGHSQGKLDLLQPVFQYIHNHLHQSIRMSELASLVGISEKYFISYFKKALGLTPGQYIYQIKMNRARDYLYEKKYTVHQIAGFLGYPDPFTFSKAFKKYYDVPPSKFV